MENGLTLSPILCDGMVFQRDFVNRIYGTETIADTVTVFFLDNRYTAAVDENSDFCVELPPMPAGGPYDIRVVGSGEITIQDILFGDVYILSGQSNMELPVRRILDVSGEEIQNTYEPFIRQYHIPASYNFSEPEKYMFAGQWKKAIGDDLLDFSAAGFFFAKEIRETFKVPVGLIMAAVGGCKVESWMNPVTLRRFGDYEKEIADFKKQEDFQVFLQKQQELAEEWAQGIEEAEVKFTPLEDYKKWDICRVPSLVSDYGAVYCGSVYLCREIVLEEEPEAEALLYMGSMIDSDRIWINGELVGRTEYRYPPRKYPVQKGILKKGVNLIMVRIVIDRDNGGMVKGKPYYLSCDGNKLDLEGDWYYRIGKKAQAKKPEILFPPKLPVCFYNTVVVPLSRVKVKGILWYQGESNTEEPEAYAEKFAAMVTDWRKLTGREVPFIYVQLANYREPLNTSEDTGWAELREQQRRNLALPGTTMVTALDIGEYNDLHPQNKKELGMRLARAAGYLIYSSGDAALHSGPLPENLRVSDGSAIIGFRYLDDSKEEYSLTNFELADSNGIYYPASAVRSGKYVTVSYEKKDVPTAVRYAWRDNPENINFYNEAGLPAPGFRLSVYDN